MMLNRNFKPMPQMVDPDEEALKMKQLAEKKKRRLERNRESARECRRRKKEKKLLLRQQLAHLEADNLQLRLKLQVGEEDNHDDQSAIITQKLNEMITNGAGESEIQKSLQELKERFSDYGRDRRSAIDFHISQLRRCLLPTQTTRAILWLMSLASKFSNGPVDMPDGPEREAMDLWFSLMREIRPTQDQKKVMLSYIVPKSDEEDPFDKIKNVSDGCTSIVDRIVEIICNKNDCVDSEMTNLQNILSARQIAKFIIWIDRNPATMQMLEALWPHTISETSPSTVPPSKITSTANISTIMDSESDEEDDDDDDSST